MSVDLASSKHSDLSVHDNQNDHSADLVEPVDCKVVVLTHYLPPYIARVLYHASSQVRDLEILLSIAQEPNRQFGDTWEGLNVSVQKSWMFRRPWKHSTGFTDELFVHVPYDTLSQLRKAKPDIVFSFELGFRSLASAVYCKVFRKKLALCVCVSEHTEQGRGRLRHWLRKALLKSAAAVTYNGPSCKKYLQDYGVEETKLFHFPYSCSDLFQYTLPVIRSPESDHRLICIGQLTQRKGVLPMLDSIADYCRKHPDRNVELDLVGKGNLEDTIRSKQLPSNFQLQLLGHMDYQQMCTAMSNCGVLLFPTMADEWGLVVNEGMQAGMPIIGSAYAQASTTLIKDGVNGWIYRPDHSNELHEKLDAMFSTSRTEMNRMREAAQQSVAHITSSNVAQKAVSMFRRLHS